MALHGVILAAGAGRRMQPFTHDTHKALLPIGGTTILRRLVQGLHEVGVSDITVVTGYRDAEVRAHLEEAFPDAALHWVHNDRYADTNNILSLALAIESLTGGHDIILSECDLLLEPGALRPLAALGAENVALVDHYHHGMDGTVLTAENGFVTAVVPPARQGANFDYAGTLKTLNVYRFQADFCERTLRPLLRWYAETVDDGSYYEQVLGMLVASSGPRIAAVVVPPNSWIEVDDPNDLAVARFQFEPEARPAILDRSFGGKWALDLEDFAFMRNEHFPTSAMLATMRDALPDLTSTYGSAQPVLDEKLGWLVGAPAERLVALAGASQAYPILRRLFADRPVSIPDPTFGEYPRVFPHATRYPDPIGYDPATLAAAAAATPPGGVLVVVSPNNPTGTTVPAAELHALAVARPDLLVLLDESFIDFSEHPSMLPLLEAAPLPNLLVLVSLSKTLGVPGLRIGYLYGYDPDLLADVRAELPVWGMAAPAEFFVELALKFRPELAASVTRTLADRDHLVALLARLDGVEHVHAEGGNFVLARLRGSAADAAALHRALLVHEAIEIKDASAKFADGRGWLRLAARPVPFSERLVTAIDRHLPR